MNELWRLSASEVVRVVRTRKASAREVAHAALQGLDSVNARINTMIGCRPDLVRKQPTTWVARGNDAHRNSFHSSIASFNFQEYAHMKTKTSSISRPVTELEYSPTGISDGVHGELYAAPAYGDLAHGPYGTFIKMPAGYVSPTHTHTEDYWAVVVSGVMVNKKPESPDVPLPAGSYYFQKGGEPHVTKCISPDGCIFFASQNGKFDYRE